jgi:hypothetical protein
MTHDYDLDLELRSMVQANQPPDGDLPDPAIIWFKAELLRKRRLREEAVRPMIRAQQAGVVLVLLALAGLILTGSVRGLAGTARAGFLLLQLLIVMAGFLAAMAWSYRSAAAE